MFKKAMDFQRVFYFPNNFDSNSATKNIWKIFLLYVLLSFAYSIILGVNNAIINTFLISIFFIYRGVNKKIRLWELVPISSKFAISNIFFSFYYIIFMIIVLGSGVVIVVSGIIYLFSGGDLLSFLEARSSFSSDIKGFSTMISIIGILVYFIMGNICITIFFIRNLKYRLSSLGALFGIVFASSYVFKLTYNTKIFSALANMENINFKYILLVISLIVFIISLFGGIKISLNLNSKIVINK